MEYCSGKQSCVDKQTVSVNIFISAGVHLGRFVQCAFHTLALTLENWVHVCVCICMNGPDFCLSEYYILQTVTFLYRICCPIHP